MATPWVPDREPLTAGFTTGKVAAIAMYAGCGVGDIADAPAAAQIVERMMAEAMPLSSPPAC